MGPPIDLQTFQDYNQFSACRDFQGLYLLYFILDGKQYTRKIIVY